MEKRSRRRIRDLVARPASLGLSENETGCARISMMARNTTFRSRAGYRSARPITSKSSLSACNARPVHTDVPQTAASTPRTTAHDVVGARSLTTAKALGLEIAEAFLLAP